MARRLIGVVESWVVQFASWLVLALTIGIPSAWTIWDRLHSIEKYFQARSVFIANTDASDSVLLDVDRSIYQPVNGEFLVEVRSMPGRSLVCTGTGSARYDPKATLPDPLTLAWWTNNAECSGATLPAGDYIVVTRWLFDVNAFLIEPREVVVESNLFTVRPVSPQAAAEAVEQQQEVLDRVQQLERQIETLMEGTDR